MNDQRSDEYQPVPVRAAREIAVKFDKDVVIILCWDQCHQRFHTTTYGRTAEWKQVAALLGETVTGAAGGMLSDKVTFEDFRTRSAAEAAETIERRHRLLEQVLFVMKDAIGYPHAWLDLAAKIETELHTPKPPGVQDGDTTRPAMPEPAGNAAPREE